MENLVIKEQLRKKVQKSGNGGAVWVPKGWLGEDILITRLETPKLTLKEEVINMLMPYMEDVSGVFVYGSYARNEESVNSDIDVLVVSKDKFSLKDVKKFDVEVIEDKKIKKAVNENPFFYSMIKEAKPIINSGLLDELKQIKFNKNKAKAFVKWFVDTTKDNIKSTREFLDMDKADGDYVNSYSTVYSTILRLKGVFILNSLDKKKTFSNKDFKQWIIKIIPESKYKIIYSIYASVRDSKKIENKIEIKYVESLVNFLEKEINNLRW